MVLPCTRLNIQGTADCAYMRLGHLPFNCADWLFKMNPFRAICNKFGFALLSTFTLWKWKLSGRVLDSRVRGFKPHQHHCVVSLSKTS